MADYRWLERLWENMWSVVIKEKKERHVEKFETREAAVEFLELAQKNFPKANIGLVSNSAAIPPDPKVIKPKQKKKTSHLWWCPYCGDYREFSLGKNSNQCCPICTISDRDYYVKTYNHLWKK